MSDTNIPELDAITAEFMSKLFQDALNGFGAQFAEKVIKLEQQVEDLEKQMATLIVGYGEQAVFMEALVAQIAFSTDEARKQFQEDVSRARKDMLKVMQDASKGILADENPDLAAAVTDVASEKLSDSNS